MLREIRNQNSSKQNNTQDRFFNAKTLTKERDKEDLGSGCLLKRGFISLIHSITLLKAVCTADQIGINMKNWF
uniref:Uncharacterized protein n=1 Tax=Salix viminalis TaxID=40686 RepID=A0A6N2LS09_SALVM